MPKDYAQNVNKFQGGIPVNQRPVLVILHGHLT